MWRWSEALQNDFAARADWCVESFDEANHPPVIKLTHDIDIQVIPGETIDLNAKGTTDPDGDELSYFWWQYEEADTYKGKIDIKKAQNRNATVSIPNDFNSGETIHIVCEVSDKGSPELTRYQRVILSIE